MTRPPADLDAWLDRWGMSRALDATAPVVVDVPAQRWVDLVTSARDDLGLTWFDALTTVDEGDGSFSVIVHLVARGTPVASLMLRVRIGGETPMLPTLGEVFAGASWHERESAEMFGVRFAGALDERRLLLDPAFEGAPLRKDFALAARAARPWPGAKDPGESDDDVAPGDAGGDGAPTRRRRRRAVPPGVPVRGEGGEW